MKHKDARENVLYLLYVMARLFGEHPPSKEAKDLAEKFVEAYANEMGIQSNEMKELYERTADYL